MCKEVRAQRQMMNVMLMTMLNKNGGRTTATHHPAQAWDKLLTNPFYYFVRSYSVFVYYNDINQYNLEAPLPPFQWDLTQAQALQVKS